MLERQWVVKYSKKDKLFPAGRESSFLEGQQSDVFEESDGAHIQNSFSPVGERF